jgi:hypothetical protein
VNHFGLRRLSDSTARNVQKEPITATQLRKLHGMKPYNGWTISDEYGDVMKHTTKHYVISAFSILSSLGWVEACSSTNTLVQATGGAENMGGTPGIGGKSAMGEASNMGGALPTGGATNANGGAVGQDCTESSTTMAPADGLVANFSDTDGGSGFPGRLLGFPFDGTAPIASIAAGALHIAQSAPATSSAQYTGVVIAFGRCIDATAFAGVQFSISGAYSGCTMKYLTGDISHQDATSGAPYATGPVGAYQPQTLISSSQLTMTPTTMKMPFDGNGLDGNPKTAINPAKIILLGWQFEIAASATGASNCVADLTIDDVKFY